VSSPSGALTATGKQLPSGPSIRGFCPLGKETTKGDSSHVFPPVDEVPTTTAIPPMTSISSECAFPKLGHVREPLVTPKV
jgi:hypothetical protein